MTFIKNISQNLPVKKLFSVSVTFTVLLLALLYNPLIERWNAKPEVYIFFAGSFMLSLFFLLKDINIEIGLNIIDRSLIVFFFVIAACELIDHHFLPFYLRDDSVSLLAILCLYVPFKSISKKYPGYLFYLIGLIALTEIFFGLFQLATNPINDKPVIGQLTGTFRNSGVFAIFLSCCQPLFFSIFCNLENTFLNKWIYRSAACIIILMVLIDLSRTGLLLIIVTFLSIYRDVVIKIWTQYVKKNVLVKIVLFLSCIASMVILLYYKYSSSIGRLFIWEVSLKMFLEKPLFGWGMSGFERYYLSHQADYFRTRLAVNPAYKYAATDVVNAFSEYIMILVRFGLAGFCIFAYFIYRIYLVYKENIRDKRCYSTLTLLLILISAVFYYSFHVTMILVLAMAALSEISVRIPPVRFDNHIVKRVGFAVLMLLLIGSFVYSSIQYNATVIWREADENNLQNNEYSLTLFNKAYPELRHRSNFLYNYGALLYQAGQYRKCIKILEECRLLQPSVDLLLYLGKAYQFCGDNMKAEACFTEASYMVPLRYAPQYFLVQLYIKNGLKEKGILIAKKILQMPVKIPSAEIEHIKNKMIMLLKKYQ